MLKLGFKISFKTDFKKFKERRPTTLVRIYIYIHTHTHTHTYIYIYI